MKYPAEIEKICFKVKFFNCQLFWDYGKKENKITFIGAAKTIFCGCFFLKIPLQFYSLN